MQVQNRITPAVITAATTLLQPYCPDLTPRNLIAALKAWGDDSQKQTQPQPPSAPSIEKPLSRFEVAKLLGVSLPTVNRLMNSGRLQKIKFSRYGTVRITPASVRALLEQTETAKSGEAI